MQDRDHQAAIRLSALRAALKSSGLNGFIVPKADEFQNEYVPAYADRLAWLTGFDHVSFARLLVLELTPNYIQ